jgi:glycosyltransferase involved in cell wall biosynthesis
MGVGNALWKLVTIVIPCYKGARFLPAAIESCLQQTYQELELIVVDDASPDECAMIAERYAQRDSRVRLIRHTQNWGVSRAFNTGFNAAKGSYFTRLAQDDVFHPEAIAAMVSDLERKHEAALTYCDCQSIDENGVIRKEPEVSPQPSRVLVWRNLVGLCVMWRRSVWEAIGGFDPEFDTAEDHEYWLRVSRSFALSKCPGGPYFFGRYHENQGSIVFGPRQESANLKIIQKYFPRLSVRDCLLRSRALSYIAFTTATVYTHTGRQPLALTRIIKSFLLWPFPYPRYGLTRPLVRCKTLIVILLRILRLKSQRVHYAAPQASTNWDDCSSAS